MGYHPPQRDRGFIGNLMNPYNYDDPGAAGKTIFKASCGCLVLMAVAVVLGFALLVWAT